MWNARRNTRAFREASLSEAALDVLIVGAGLSGIGAACHLSRRLPGKSYTILEGRSRLGGTWDLFRYPGVRSDSDMYTLGYGFKPWTKDSAIGDGAAIRDYIADAARENGVDRRIRYDTRVKRAEWSSRDALWTIEAEQDGGIERLRCRYLLMCAGYYRYDAGYSPAFPGAEAFLGKFVHPQFWREDLDYSGKRVLIIGSGATAVTLLPAMAQRAAHVTMLQRSPTYIVARPAADPLARRLRRALPIKWAYTLMRWNNLLYGQMIYARCKRAPEVMKRLFVGAARHNLGPDYNVEKHFTPRYNPWEQRLCLDPDGEFYEAIRSGRASVETDEIETFTPSGVRLKGGGAIDADIVVTATGLELQPLGEVAFSVDGAEIDVAALVTYKGMMFAGLPNMAAIFGYINASWTLRSDLISRTFCRLIDYMDRRGYVACTPRHSENANALKPWIVFSSGYFQRGVGRFPKQGARDPWRLNQSYLRDLWALRAGGWRDGALQFERAGAAAPR